MKIAVVTRMLRKDKLEGFGVFTHEILSRIVRQHPEHEFLFIFDRSFDREFVYGENVKPFVVPPRASHPWLLAFWYQFMLDRFLKKHKPDVLISPDGGIPLNAKVPTLSVIHDLNFEHFPEDLPSGVRNYYQKYYRRIAHAATRIVTVSAFSKKDIGELYGSSENKIDVTYNGAGEKFIPLAEHEKEKVRRQYADGKPYLLFVGSIHQRKNLPNMMLAFTQFRKTNVTEMKFIVAGAKRWWSEEMETAFEQSPFKKDILFAGRISDEDLPVLIGGAHALLFASRFEGFGIPIVEAMKCGVPVITSTTSSMPEVAGDAGVLVDPASVESIAEAIHQVTSDETLRKNLIEKGIARAKLFSWDRSAEIFWQSIEKTVSR